MSKIQSVDESVFWELVSKAGWESDRNFTRIKLELMKALTPSSQAEFESLFNKYTGQLAKKIDNYCDSNDTSTGCGDDSFSDLVAHIVGLGKAEYDRVMADPELAVKRAKKGEYGESFSYAIPSKYDQEEITKSKYINKAKEYLEQEGIANFLSLPEKKKEALSVLNDVDVEKHVKVMVELLQEVAAGNLDVLNVEGFEVGARGYDAVSSNTLYQAWNAVTTILNIHYGIPNLINDYNKFKDLIE